jgi:hypothetical protein
MDNLVKTGSSGAVSSGVKKNMISLQAKNDIMAKKFKIVLQKSVPG